MRRFGSGGGMMHVADGYVVDVVASGISDM